jgi:hypothetical protein
VEPIDVFAALFDVTPITVVTTANWQKIRVTLPRWQFLRDHTVWRRMHFEDWDRLPAGLRSAGLDQVLDRYGWLTTARDAWTTMTPEDWDSVPQPIRAMAFVTMIEHWVAFYRVGDAFALDPRDVLQTVKAVAMTESWFDHRAEFVNRDGSKDVGLGGASEFARRLIRRWHLQGKCDFTLTDDEYANPWLASRWLAFWFDLMLHEAGGDIDLAIRAYNWGIGRAIAGAGGPYLQIVQRRRHRYFEGPSQSPTWRRLSQYRRQQTSVRRSRAATMRTFGASVPSRISCLQRPPASGQATRATPRSTRTRHLVGVISIGPIDDISWNSRHVVTRGGRRVRERTSRGLRDATRCLQ